ncbi:Conserved hypothetical protein CHP02757 [Emticicia oligotrophica DSM 17448]|uniref:TIGR02757 family protein n=1 Tax=Emticicia oligotrophica (strain DSM 17448 / CIP 109782 / MTCC 6937 / GPTSA100-15) TaxID=929562 RepID=A0ABN4ADQ6_EMTOG|nr:TIGR02757 family protein [Emticicia oligotrophica]AFK01727.1 Conserved hypothetical protein CHP02757 [Emticicia oligotrophica DSM 17448]
MTQLIVDLLNEKYELFNQPNFIPNDPICIPHQFTLKQDIEITGFIAATLAWGQRKTIINKCNELISLMDKAPYDFIKNHQDSDLKRFLSFKHRTFNATDTLYFIEFFKDFYSKNESFENAFLVGLKPENEDMRVGLENFQKVFFGLEDYPTRTRKHIATPARNSTCKRINMFLRWMVRKDEKGVDFGIWNQINTSQLVCPCDVHVERVARKLGLITRPKADWQMAIELTKNLKQLDPLDPVKYDFALFGLGVEGYL